MYPFWASMLAWPHEHPSSRDCSQCPRRQQPEAQEFQSAGSGRCNTTYSRLMFALLTAPGLPETLFPKCQSGFVGGSDRNGCIGHRTSSWLHPRDHLWHLIFGFYLSLAGCHFTGTQKSSAQPMLLGSCGTGYPIQISTKDDHDRLDTPT